MKEALNDAAFLEKTCSAKTALDFGFGVIKETLQHRVRNRPEELRTAMQTTGYGSATLVVILARNLVCDELEAGHHMLFTQLSSSGKALYALHGHLTEVLEKAGVETADEARASRQYLRDTLRERFDHR